MSVRFLRNGIVFNLLLWTSLFALTAQAGQEESCNGAQVIIEVSTDGKPVQLYTAFPSRLGLLPPSKRTQFVPLKGAEPADACSPLDASLYSGSAVLVERGGCTFMEKARAVQAANASTMVVYNDDEGCFQMGVNGSATLGRLNISSISVARSTGEQMKINIAGGATVAIWLPRNVSLDPSAAILWVMAVATVVGAAVWAGNDFMQEVKCTGRGADDEGVHGKGSAASTAPEVLVVTGQAAVGFVFMASAMLLLLFFFMNHIFAVVLTVMFCFGALQALTIALSAMFGRCASGWQGHHSVLPVVGQVDSLSLAASLPAAVTVIVWFCARRTSWAWPLQDAMGISLMLLLLRQFRLPNIKVACILLPLCFVYDVFWVFIEPLIMGGTSVMVEVATGEASHEALPMLLTAPNMRGGPNAGYSVLGFGDVVLPGLLLVYARIFDLRHHSSLWAGYFLPASVGYGCGLILTFVALLLELFGDQGQPALLYLIPCTLGVVLALSYCRGDLAAMWDKEKEDPGDVLKGRLPCILEEDEEEDESDIEQGLLRTPSDSMPVLTAPR
ncbi:g8396 [Coccomyxa elongata]